MRRTGQWEFFGGRLTSLKRASCELAYAHTSALARRSSDWCAMGTYCPLKSRHSELMVPLAWTWSLSMCSTLSGDTTTSAGKSYAKKSPLVLTIFMLSRTNRSKMEQKWARSCEQKTADE